MNPSYVEQPRPGSDSEYGQLQYNNLRHQHTMQPLHTSDQYAYQSNQYRQSQMEEENLRDEEVRSDRVHKERNNSTSLKVDMKEGMPKVVWVDPNINNQQNLETQEHLKQSFIEAFGQD